MLALCAVLLAGCSWHRVEPRLEGEPSERSGATVGLAVADGDTSLTDLQAIARLWTQWKAFERVLFPFREGELLGEIAAGCRRPARGLRDVSGRPRRGPHPRG